MPSCVNTEFESQRVELIDKISNAMKSGDSTSLQQAQIELESFIKSFEKINALDSKNNESKQVCVNCFNFVFYIYYVSHHH